MTQAMRQSYYTQQIVDLVRQRQPLDASIIEALDISHRDSEGKNALYWAIEHKSKRNVSLLIDGGVSLTVKDGLHALFHTIEVDNLETLALLLEKGLSINTFNRKGQSLLMKALEKESLLIVQYLLNNEIDLYMMDDDYDMAMDYAQRCKNKKVFELVYYKVLNDKAKEDFCDCSSCGCGTQQNTNCGIIKF